MSERDLLFKKFKNKLEDTKLYSRKTVSFQANKVEPIYRWFKYKEGFAAVLVKSILQEYAPQGISILDPFAGVGTTSFASAELGWQATGIELLPVGTFVMQVRSSLKVLDKEEFLMRSKTFWNDVITSTNETSYFNHIPITKDAFPHQTERLLNKYIGYCQNIPDENVRNLFRFAAFSILEEISYTRKDGQYLRWDSRSPRSLKGQFDKGKILSFEDAIKNKISDIVKDIEQNVQDELFKKFEPVDHGGIVNIVQGSCLDVLPGMKSEQFDFVITSPPYCNRYDYTRTYALELVFLNQSNEDVRNLRQSMLSCTVENKEKVEYLSDLYARNNNFTAFKEVLSVYENVAAMGEINNVLDELLTSSKLNNPGIPRMVKNYFLEMCFVIYELSRLLKKDGYIAMVNDNVRYGGEEIPVDLILSEFASSFGLDVKKIFVLSQKKGNSSQQMGVHGRTEIRKCVYLWQKSN